MRKMTEENNRHKEEDGRKNKEICKLRKEARKQLNTIKSLEAQQAAKDQVNKISVAVRQSFSRFMSNRF